MANIIIGNVQMTPNPVQTGRQFIISVGIVDKVYAMLTSDGKYIETAAGIPIEKRPAD